MSLQVAEPTREAPAEAAPVAQAEPPRRRSLRDVWTSLVQLVSARWYLRRCAHVGRRVRTRGKPVLEIWGGRIEIGDRVRIASHIVPVELAAVGGGRLTIGARTGINYGVSLSAFKEVTIGENCLISPYVNIMDSDHHSVNDRESCQARPVRIGDNVWLGAKAIVLKGVTIGDNSVVSAGSVVSCDVPPNVVVAGNPARVIQKIEPKKS